MYPVLKRHTFATWVFFVLLALAAWQLVHYYPLMPEHMASHFSGSGKADGWSEKSSFFILFGGMTAFLAAIFFGLAVAIPAFPVSTVNIPNREHYLSPEHRDETYRTIISFMIWFGSVTIAFFMWIADQTFRANLMPEPRLGDGFMIGLVAYLVFSVVATIALIVRFAKKPPRTI